MTLDLSSDYLVADNVETVTLTPQGTGSTPITGVKALRRVATTMQIAMLANIGVDIHTIIFNLFTATLGGAVPTNGDKITDANNVVYTILSADKVSLGSRYRVLANPQVVNQP